MLLLLLRLQLEKVNLVFYRTVPHKLVKPAWKLLQISTKRHVGKPEGEDLDDGVVLLLADEAQVQHQLHLVAHHLVLHLQRKNK